MTPQEFKKMTNDLEIDVTIDAEFVRLKQAYKQIAENLSYYIGLADRYYQELEVVRNERDELAKKYEMVLFERDELKVKLQDNINTDWKFIS
jgi:UDP-galactopyranose mutase